MENKTDVIIFMRSLMEMCECWVRCDHRHYYIIIIKQCKCWALWLLYEASLSPTDSCCCPTANRLTAPKATALIQHQICYLTGTVSRFMGKIILWMGLDFIILHLIWCYSCLVVATILLVLTVLILYLFVHVVEFPILDHSHTLQTSRWILPCESLIYGWFIL